MGHVVVEQLPVVLARVARPYTGASLADVRSDAVRWSTGRGPGFCGLTNCFGAPISTLGSEVTPLEGGLVCDIAVPPRPHTRPATKSDENLIALSSQMPGRPFPSRFFQKEAKHHLKWPMYLANVRGQFLKP